MRHPGPESRCPGPAGTPHAAARRLTLNRRDGPPMAKTHRQLTVGEAALKGALAGALGGAAMLAAEALASRRLLSRDGSAPDEWGRVAAAVGRRTGTRVRGRPRAAAGVGLHLAYSALVGALYGIARTRGDLSGPAQSLLRSGLEYAGFRAERGFIPRRGRARLARHGARQGVLPLDAQGIFAMATSQLWKTLTK